MMFFAATKHVRLFLSISIPYHGSRFLSGRFTVVHLVLAIFKQRERLAHLLNYNNDLVERDLRRHIYMKAPRILNGNSAGKIDILFETLYGLGEVPYLGYDPLLKESLRIGLKTINGSPCCLAVMMCLLLSM